MKHAKTRNVSWKTLAGLALGTGLASMLFVGCQDRDVDRTEILAKTVPIAPVEKAYFAPVAVLGAADGKTLYVAGANGRVVELDPASGQVVHSLTVPAEVTGMAAGAGQLFVTSVVPAGTVSVIDIKTWQVRSTMAAGAGACAPVVDDKAGRLYVANEFTNDIVVLDTHSGKELGRVDVVREPASAALSPDGATLVVGNLVPAGPANADHVAATVSLIDARQAKTVAQIALPNGSSSVRGVAVSPDGHWAWVTHVLSRYTVPTTQLERGWMNTNALSIIDLPAKKLLNTVLLDDVDRGAANPWGVAVSADGSCVVVTHGGSQEISIIAVKPLLEKLNQAKAPDEVPNQLSFLLDMRRRVHVNGNGPRAVAIVGPKAYVAEYFTDSLTSVILAEGGKPSTIPLGPEPQWTVRRRGEVYFHDASLCFQGWQSCITCHPNSRVDGLNWDLLNDGIGNPKNTKSMVLAHQTMPVGWMGVRETAEKAVRAGIKYIQFAVRPEQDAAAIDEYLKSLTPAASPFLVEGRLSDAARRGQKIFHDESVGCAHCHTGALFTDQLSHDVGTIGSYDKPEDRFITPMLIEAWRTAPYLHDGSAGTLRDLVTTSNKQDRHGRTSQLSPQQIDDLVAFVRSL